MRVTVNLATRPFADLGPILLRLRIGIGVLAVAAIALGAGLHALHSKAEVARARERQVDGSIADLNREQQGYQVILHQPDNAQILDQAASLNKLIDEKAFSWTLAMEDLETVLPGGVQVSTLEPTVDKKDGHITVRLRVVGPRDKAVDLVANLEHSRRFLLPRIVNEAAESSSNSNTQQLEPVSMSNRVNFEIQADYNPLAPGERKAHKKLATEQETPAASPRRARGPLGPRPGIRPGLRRPPYPGARPVPPDSHAGGPR